MIAATNPLDSLIAEASRALTICNACRYCEGFCAVFPAMTRRLDFTEPDIHYLANLCHNCGACLHACQYAPPHVFAVNIPIALSAVRAKSQETYAWPQQFAKIYYEAGAGVAMGLSAIFSLLLLFIAESQSGLWRPNLNANFYAIFPHNALALVFGAVFIAAAAAIYLGVRNFWVASQANENKPTALSKPLLNAAMLDAAHQAATLKHLGGGHGEGCNEESDRYTLVRRRFHHATVVGFLLCLASTSVATLYHYLFAWQAPYSLFSAPVILGTIGGISLAVGTGGLLWLKLRRHPLHIDVAQKPMDVAFITLLWLVAVTGLVLLALRSTPLMPSLLCIHLGCVMAFFISMPYGKFAHGFYRSAALLK